MGKFNTARTEWNQCTFQPGHNQNSRHLTRQIYDLHHPWISAVTSLKAPTPLELCNVDSTMYNQDTNAFLRTRPLDQVELFGKKVSLELLEAHNQKPLHGHLHPEGNWMALNSCIQHLLHGVQLPHAQCLPHICIQEIWTKTMIPTRKSVIKSIFLSWMRWKGK